MVRLCSVCSRVTYCNMGGAQCTCTHASAIAHVSFACGPACAEVRVIPAAPCKPNLAMQKHGSHLTTCYCCHGVHVEEKVDGANLGISFATAHGPARCQKRGRWVTPDSEAQFAKLQAWLEAHQEDLRAVLGRLLSLLSGC